MSLSKPRPPPLELPAPSTKLAALAAVWKVKFLPGDAGIEQNKEEEQENKKKKKAGLEEDPRPPCRLSFHLYMSCHRHFFVLRQAHGNLILTSPRSGRSVVLGLFPMGRALLPAPHAPEPGPLPIETMTKAPLVSLSTVSGRAAVEWIRSAMECLRRLEGAHQQFEGTWSGVVSGEGRRDHLVQVDADTWVPRTEALRLRCEQIVREFPELTVLQTTLEEEEDWAAHLPVRLSRFVTGGGLVERLSAQGFTAASMLLFPSHTAPPYVLNWVLVSGQTMNFYRVWTANGTVLDLCPADPDDPENVAVMRVGDLNGTVCHLPLENAADRSVLLYSLSYAMSHGRALLSRRPWLRTLPLSGLFRLNVEWYLQGW